MTLLHYKYISACFNINYTVTFTITIHIFLSYDELETCVISENFPEKRRNDLISTSLTDLQFNTKLRIPNRISPI